MTTVRIPASVEEAVARLATAREWERAAIVAAFVRLQDGVRRRTMSPRAADMQHLRAAVFAKLGIHGLGSEQTVLLYVRRWLDAHDGMYPEPGTEIELPDLDWPPTRTGTDNYESDDHHQPTPPAGGVEFTDEQIARGRRLVADLNRTHAELARLVATAPADLEEVNAWVEILLDEYEDPEEEGGAE